MTWWANARRNFYHIQKTIFIFLEWPTGLTECWCRFSLTAWRNDITKATESGTFGFERYWTILVTRLCMVRAFLPFPFNLPYRFPFPFPCPFPTIHHPFGGFHGKVSGENLKISQPHLIHLIISSHRTHAIEIVKGQWLLRNFHVFFSSVSLP